MNLLDELRAVESTINPNLPSRNDETWKIFFQWFDKNNTSEADNEVLTSSRVSICAQTNSSKSNHYLFGQDECSLITKVPITTGEKVFAVNRNLMMTTETAMKDLDLEDFIRNDMIASGMQNVVLVLHLLNEYSKGEGSFWWPYLSILPRKLLPVLRLTSTKLKQHLLASSNIFEALKMLRAIARQYTYFHKRLQSTKLPLKQNFTFLYYAWGVSIVCSRQNEIPSLQSKNRKHHQSGPSAHALIPLLDMCNHNIDSSQPIFVDEASCLLASENLDAGQEVTINYGRRSSGDFYIHSGFVPDKVPLDSVPLIVGLPDDNLKLAKAKLLKILNMPKTIGRFKLVHNSYANRHRRDPHLTMFLIVYCLNESELYLIIDDDNPVGLADYVYDYIQYKANADKNNQSEDESDARNENEYTSSTEINEMKLRLADCCKDYLRKRSTICVALIDRNIKELLPNTNSTNLDANEDEDGNEEAQDDKLYAIKLLQREKEIYESYMDISPTLNE